MAALSRATGATFTEPLLITEACSRIRFPSGGDYDGLAAVEPSEFVAV